MQSSSRMSLVTVGVFAHRELVPVAVCNQINMPFLAFVIMLGSGTFLIFGRPLSLCCRELTLHRLGVCFLDGRSVSSRLRSVTALP